MSQKIEIGNSRAHVLSLTPWILQTLGQKRVLRTISELETDRTSTKSIESKQSYGPKRVTMSRIFFSTKFLRKRPVTKILLVRLLDTNEVIVSTSHIDMIRGTPQGNEIRASERNSSKLMPRPLQIGHLQAKFHDFKISRFRCHETNDPPKTHQQTDLAATTFRL